MHANDFVRRPVSAAIFVIEIEDVLVARITSGFMMRSRSRKISALISNFSVAASIDQIAIRQLRALQHRCNLP